jgi:hypothetical protein
MKGHKMSYSGKLSQSALFVLTISIITLHLQGRIASASTGSEKYAIDLTGQWSFQLDPKNVGEAEKWFKKDLADKIKLPGSTTENGFGDDITVDTQWVGSIVDRSWFTDEAYAEYRKPGNVKVPFWLTPVKHYMGPAWYQKTVDVPASWQNKRIVLFLERTHWETRLWVDDTEIGVRTSLSTPHEYDLGTLSPGPHRITLCVDNRVKIGVGPNSHSVSDHTQTNWNGIIGKIELRATDLVWLDDVQVYPNIQNKTAKVRVTIRNAAKQQAEGTLTLQAATIHSQQEHKPAPKTIPFAAPLPYNDVEVEYDMGSDALLWDEFSPNVYQMTASIDGNSFSDAKSVDFGMREFSASGTQFTINGKKRFIRGTLECCIFPLTGYPPTTPDEWLRIINVAKSHGLNQFRFHSWCPPQAAFIAADKAGFTFQVECGSWANWDSFGVGDGNDFDGFIYSESERILKAYGNHPSFCMLAYGNEPGGKNHPAFLAKLVEYWKQIDSRRLYTSAAGWPALPQSQYHNNPHPRIHHWQAGLSCRLNAKPPETVTDYSDFVKQYPAPVVSHEIGQWCVYPNFDEIKKYTGVTRAYNFEIFRDTLEQNHMLDQAHGFLIASGKLQTICYKEEIESALRTPGFGGFHLLDLHDFPGQGTALVGVVDPFWDYKGYVTAQQYHRFACETVPLAKMQKRIFTPDETFQADIEIAHFGPDPIENAVPLWTITDSKGAEIASDKLTAATIPLGNGIKLGTIEQPLAKITAAQKMVLTVSIQGTPYSNDWDFWVYPPGEVTKAPKGILLTDKLDSKALKKLKSGGKVILIPGHDTVKGDKYGKVPPGFTTIFWNTAWTSREAPHTLGILCDPNHPALAEFPTEFHSNWQWWDIVTKSQIMIINDLPPKLRPIVQTIDDWYTNRRLALVFEADVNGGKLLVCGIDLRSDLTKRPVARRMLHSLIKYVASKDFAPTIKVTPEQIKGLFVQ